MQPLPNRKFEYSFDSMSTKIDITLYSKKHTVEVNDVFLTIENIFKEIVKKYSRFDQNSILCRMNREGALINPEPEFIEILRLLIELAELTNGEFDPTVIDILEIYGYKNTYTKNDFKSVDISIKSINSYIKNRSNYKDINITSNELILKNKVRIDIGSIGKGWAIESILKVINKISNHYLISAGGDLYFKGQDLNLEKNWDLGILFMDQNQSTKKIISIFAKSPSGSLATSGSWARSLGKFSHLINLNKSKSSEILQASIFHKNPRFADVLSSVLAICGEGYLDILQNKYDAKGIIITKTGKIYVSERFDLFDA